MTEPRLEVQNVKIKQLVGEYRSGRVVIPEFQREYVWKRSKAPKLIDSLYRGFQTPPRAMTAAGTGSPIYGTRTSIGSCEEIWMPGVLPTK